MRGAVPVLFTAHLASITVTRQVSALNPALRIPPNVGQHIKNRNMTVKLKIVLIAFLVLIIPIGLIVKRAIAIEIQKEAVNTLSNTSSQSDIDEAIKRINLAIKLAPRNYLFYASKAQILQSQKKYREAIHEFEKIHKFKDDYAEGYIAIGMNYEKIGMSDSAKYFYNISLDSYNSRIKKYSRDRERVCSEKINRAYVYALLGDTIHSRREFDQIKIDYPDNIDIIEQIELINHTKDILDN